MDDVIAQLTDVCRARGVDLEERVADDAPHKPLTDAIRYLQNNRARMDYPRYRRLGLPVTSAPMESLIKQINHRVKGTEMFWDDPGGSALRAKADRRAFCSARFLFGAAQKKRSSGLALTRTIFSFSIW